MLLAIPVELAAIVRLADFRFDLLSSTVFFTLFIGGLMLWKKKEIRAALLATGVPKEALFFLAAFAMVVLEENVNCPRDGCALLPWTLAPFALLCIVEFAAVKIAKIKDWHVAVALFGAMGWFAEFGPGGSWASELWALPLPVLAVMSALAFLIYAAIILVPAYVLVED